MGEAKFIRRDSRTSCGKTSKGAPRQIALPIAGSATRAFTPAFDNRRWRTSIHRLDFHDRGAVVAADPERHRRSRVVHQKAADVSRLREQVFDDLAGLGI